MRIVLFILAPSLLAQVSEVQLSGILPGGSKTAVAESSVSITIPGQQLPPEPAAKSSELCPAVLMHAKLDIALSKPEKGTKFFKPDELNIDWLRSERNKMAGRVAEALIVRLRAYSPANGVCQLDLTEDEVTLPFLTVDLTTTYRMFNYLEYLTASYTALSRVDLSEFRDSWRVSIVQDAYNLRKECLPILETKSPAWPNYATECVQLAKALARGVDPHELGLDKATTRTLLAAKIK